MLVDYHHRWRIVVDEHRQLQPWATNRPCSDDVWWLCLVYLHQITHLVAPQIEPISAPSDGRLHAAPHPPMSHRPHNP